MLWKEMASNPEKRTDFNNVRTILLLLANNELTIYRQNNSTLINSKKLTEAEDYYTVNNNNVITLKEENFIPNSHTRDVIQTKNIKNRCIYRSPDIIKKNTFKKIRFKISRKNLPIINIKNNPNINNLKLEFQLFEKKSDISQKKNEYFKRKTLNLKYENILGSIV